MTDDTSRAAEQFEVETVDSPSIPPDLPLLPLRDTVLFPNSFMPLAVAREASVRLIDEATASGRMIGVFTQREAGTEEPLRRCRVHRQKRFHWRRHGGRGRSDDQRTRADRAQL